MERNSSGYFLFFYVRTFLLFHKLNKFCGHRRREAFAAAAKKLLFCLVYSIVLFSFVGLQISSLFCSFVVDLFVRRCFVRSSLFCSFVVVLFKTTLRLRLKCLLELMSMIYLRTSSRLQLLVTAFRTKIDFQTTVAAMQTDGRAGGRTDGRTDRWNE